MTDPYRGSKLVVSIAASFSVFAISFPILNYFLQQEAGTSAHLWSEAKSGFLTLRLTNISVGAALALLVLRVSVDLLGGRHWPRALSVSSNRFYRVRVLP